MKITVTNRVDLDACSNFFTTGDVEKLVYTASARVPDARARLGPVATVVDGGRRVRMRRLSEDLADRGVERLMVEGGGVVHTQFLADDLVDELQLVVAPFFVGDSSAPRFVTDGHFPWNANRRAALAVGRPIRDVVRLRDERRFANRRVDVRQGDVLLASALVSHLAGGRGLEHGVDVHRKILGDEPGDVVELGIRAHRRSDDLDLLEEQLRQVQLHRRTGGAAAHDEAPARLGLEQTGEHVGEQQRILLRVEPPDAEDLARSVPASLDVLTRRDVVLGHERDADRQQQAGAPVAASHLGADDHDRAAARQQAEAALEPRVGPLDLFLGRRDEHDVQTQRIGAELLQHRVGIDDVPFRLRHDGAVLEHHALGQQVCERFIALHQA